MKLEEAIEELRGMMAIPEVRAIRGQFKYEEAIQLGIEALERVKFNRQGIYPPVFPLPSETED